MTIPGIWASPCLRGLWPPQSARSCARRGRMSQTVMDYLCGKSHPELIKKLGIDGMDPWGWALFQSDLYIISA